MAKIRFVAPQNNRGGDSVTRMTQFWRQPEHSELFAIGRLLAADDFAVQIANGETVDLGSVLEFEDRNTYLAIAEPSQLLSLNQLIKWACPACLSAHGTGKGTSASRSTVPNPARLATCEFYYSQVSGRLFTISQTCFDKYVDGWGKKSRIIEVPYDFDNRDFFTPRQLDNVSDSVVQPSTNANRISLDEIINGAE